MAASSYTVALIFFCWQLVDTMKNHLKWIATAAVGAVLLAFSGLALAQNCDHSSSKHCTPEIDGALSIQALALLGGALYLLKRKK
jgi:hypothetical protein